MPLLRSLVGKTLGHSSREVDPQRTMAFAAALGATGQFFEWPDDGAPAVHKVVPLSLTFDHRAVSGGEAGRFLAAMMEDLQKAS